MKRDIAKRVARLVLGNPITFNDEELVDRMAKAITERGGGNGVMTIPELKSRLRSFIDRCNNAGIETIGDFFNQPIRKL